MNWNVYLSGEIHTNWRDEIFKETKELSLEINFLGPVTNHGSSDDCGAIILGQEELKFWHDHKGAKLNAIRTRKAIQNSDIVVVKFGEKYRQWNAAFDAGYASALGKSLIIIHSGEHQHALKEVDAAALAVTKNTDEVVQILKYTLNGNI
jgi:YtoQ family protein